MKANNMLKILITSILTTAILGIIAFNLPVWKIDKLYNENMLGASVTEIAAGDKMSTFPTVYNANLNALNSAKIEISTTTLPNITTLTSLTTVGTIGTGVWQGTDVGVAYGGTGASTLTAYSVLLGNGTSAISTVSGLGTSGQFLTSNGAGSAPTWQTSSVTLSDDYAWTGKHTFSTASTTFNGQTYLNDVNIASGTLNEYPTASTSIATKGYTDKTILKYTASANLKAIAPTERSEAGDTYTQVKSIVVNGGGTVRADWQMHGTDAGSVYSKIYVNGVAVGTEKTAGSSSYATSTEATINIFPGAEVQLWIHGQVAGSDTCYVKNFTIFYDVGAGTQYHYNLQD